MEIQGSDLSDNKRILLVEDSNELAILMHSRLLKAGYEVKVAESGEVALKLLAEYEFDLVILDIMLPRISGFDVCVHIRANEKTRDLPVIFMTGFDVPDVKERCAQAGGNELVLKPLENSILLALIGKYLN